MLSGEDLAPYKTSPSESCWWCGGRPITQEHKFKQRDLVRAWSAEGLVWGDDVNSRPVRSARKSQVVRFRASLCAPCNNHRSQPFDVAYDVFSDYAWEARSGLLLRRYVDMKDLYGPGWPEQTLNLARYFAKHIACRMVHDGFAVPSSIPDFLNGASQLSDVHMALYKDQARHRLQCMGQREGFDARGLWIAPATGAVSKSRQRLSMYFSSITIGSVGVLYRWEEHAVAVDSFYNYQRARLHSRRRLPAF